MVGDDNTQLIPVVTTPTKLIADNDAIVKEKIKSLADEDKNVEEEHYLTYYLRLLQMFREQHNCKTKTYNHYLARI